MRPMGAISAIKARIQKAASIDDALATALALFLLGCRNKIKVMGHVAHFWVLVVGESSITHKSAAERAMLTGLYSKHHVFGTLEGLKKAWVDNDGNMNMVLVADEFGSFLKQAKSGSAGYKVLVDALNTLHDGKEYTFPETKNKGVTIPAGLKLSIIASTTPEAFEKNVTTEILQGGLFKRLLVVKPRQAEYTPPWEMEESKLRVTTYEAEWNENQEVQLSEGVKAKHSEFMREQMNASNWAGFWQRGERMMLDIAAIHSALERGNAVINTEDWEFAMQTVAYSITSQKVLCGGGA